MVSIFESIKGFFAKKEEKRLTKQKQEHDILVDAMNSPKESSKEIINKQNNSDKIKDFNSKKEHSLVKENIADPTLIPKTHNVPITQEHSLVRERIDEPIVVPKTHDVPITQEHSLVKENIADPTLISKKSNFKKIDYKNVYKKIVNKSSSDYSFEDDEPLYEEDIEDRKQEKISEFVNTNKKEKKEEIKTKNNFEEDRNKKEEKVEDKDNFEFLNKSKDKKDLKENNSASIHNPNSNLVDSFELPDINTSSEKIDVDNNNDNKNADNNKKLDLEKEKEISFENSDDDIIKSNTSENKTIDNINTDSSNDKDNNNLSSKKKSSISDRIGAYYSKYEEIEEKVKKEKPEEFKKFSTLFSHDNDVPQAGLNRYKHNELAIKNNNIKNKKDDNFEFLNISKKKETSYNENNQSSVSNNSSDNNNTDSLEAPKKKKDKTLRYNLNLDSSVKEGSQILKKLKKFDD